MSDLTDDVLTALDDLLSLMPDAGDDLAQEAVSDLVVAAAAALTAVLGSPAAAGAAAGAVPAGVTPLQGRPA